MCSETTVVVLQFSRVMGGAGGSRRVYCYIRHVPLGGLISTRMIGHASTTRSAGCEGQTREEYFL